MNRRDRILQCAGANPQATASQIARESGVSTGYASEVRTIADGKRPRSRLLLRIQEETGLDGLDVIFTLYQRIATVHAGAILTRLLKRNPFVTRQNLDYYLAKYHAQCKAFKPDDAFIAALCAKLDPQDQGIFHD